MYKDPTGLVDQSIHDWAYGLGYDGCIIDEPNYAVFVNNNGEYKLWSTGILESGWLRLSTAPTVYASSRDVSPHQNANKWDWAMQEEVSDINYYARQDMSARGLSVEVITGDNGLLTDGDGRYWVAVGPNVMNPNHTSNMQITPKEMKYGTKIDIVVSDENGNIYYIPAAVGDAKEHSNPDGLYQTGVPFDTNRPTVKGDGSTVEIMRNTVKGTDNYKLVKIVVYD